MVHPGAHSQSHSATAEVVMAHVQGPGADPSWSRHPSCDCPELVGFFQCHRPWHPQTVWLSVKFSMELGIIGLEMMAVATPIRWPPTRNSFLVILGGTPLVDLEWPWHSQFYHKYVFTHPDSPCKHGFYYIIMVVIYVAWLLTHSQDGTRSWVTISINSGWQWLTSW